MVYEKLHEIRNLMRLVVQEYLSQGMTGQEFDTCLVLISNGYTLEEVLSVVNVKSLRKIDAEVKRQQIEVGEVEESNSK